MLSEKKFERAMDNLNQIEFKLFQLFKSRIFEWERLCKNDIQLDPLSMMLDMIFGV